MNKRNIDLAIISDVHLGTLGANAEDLLQYLKRIHPKVLILNGDFIDGWNFKKKNFPPSHYEVLRRLLKMINKGTKVYYLTGNHDEFLRRYHGLSIQGFTILDQLTLELDGKKAWFFHGDIFDTSIQGNMKYLSKLGGRAYDLLIWMNRKVNGGLRLLGRSPMSFSKSVKRSVKLAVKWINDFEQIAAEMAISKGYDYVCCGHIHTPIIRNYSNDQGKVTYLNSGDWIENNSALEYHDGVWSVSTFWQYQDPEVEVFEEDLMEDFATELELTFAYSNIKVSKAI